MNNRKLVFADLAMRMNTFSFINKKTNSKPSFLKEFFVYILLVIISILCLFLWFTHHIHSSYSNYITENIEKTLCKIEKNFTDTIEYNEYILNVLGTQIIDDSLRSNEKFESILKSFVHTSKLPWTSFSWVDNQKRMLVDSVYGILRNPIDMSSRDYLRETCKSPGKICLGKPVIGSTSKRWMIPAGLGVLDKNGKCAGTITTGFDIYSLEQALNVFLDEGVDYVIIDSKNRIIMCSDEKKINVWLHNSQSHYNIELLNNDHNLKKINSEDQNLSISYILKKSRRYPYVIGIFYNKRFISQEVFGIVVLQVLQLLFISALLGILFILFFIRFIKPLKQLSNMADDITRGYPIKVVPTKWYTHEIANLKNHLIKLKTLIDQEKSAKYKLEKAMKIINSSDKTRQAFIQKVQHDMQKPLKTILSTINILKRHVSGQMENPLHQESELKCLQNIYNSALEIKTLTSDSLDLSKFSIKEALKECIEIHAKNFHINNIKISLDLDKNLPKIEADKIKFKQVIVGLISRALDCSPENSKININVKLKKEKGDSFIIRITDNGFGLSNKDRLVIAEKYLGGFMWGNLMEATYFNIDSIEKVIKLHKGDIKFNDDYNAGSVVTLILPINQQNNSERFLNKDNVIAITEKRVFN